MTNQENGYNKERADSTEQLQSFLKDLLDPWFTSLTNPKQAQEELLSKLLKEYSKTEFGEKYGAKTIKFMSEFQTAFPVTNYKSLEPYFEQVKAGNYSSILSEPAENWVMTRGTTGKPKVIPTTESHLSQILFVGSRAITNFALHQDIHILQRNVLNLNFPSEVFSMNLHDGQKKYGYSSGTYAKLHPTLDAASLVPKQEEIDALGGGITNADWKRRFELVYEKSRASNVGCVMGVTPVIIAFALFLRHNHGRFPKDIWKMNALFCTSIAKIHSKYSPELKYYYGNIPVVEMYSATEGVFAQQLDKNPYVCPNYDIYLFEVKTRNNIKLLHELKRNEWGSLLVSSTLFPRYEIGDLIECIGNGYFRVFGRKSSLTITEHNLYNLFAGRLTSR